MKRELVLNVSSIRNSTVTASERTLNEAVQCNLSARNCCKRHNPDKEWLHKIAVDGKLLETRFTVKYVTVTLQMQFSNRFSACTMQIECTPVPRKKPSLQTDQNVSVAWTLVPIHSCLSVTITLLRTHKRRITIACAGRDVTLQPTVT